MSMIKKLTVGLGAMVMSATISTAAAAEGNKPPATGGCGGQPVCGGTKPEPEKPAPVPNHTNNSAGASSNAAAQAAAAAEAAANAKAASVAQNNGSMTVNQNYDNDVAAAPVILGGDGSGYCTEGKKGGFSIVQLGASFGAYGPKIKCIETVAQYSLANAAFKETLQAVKDGIASPAAAGVAFAGTVAMIPQWQAAVDKDTKKFSDMFMAPAQRTTFAAPPVGTPVKASEQGTYKCPPNTVWTGTHCKLGLSN